jgi:hypothetical protein
LAGQLGADFLNKMLERKWFKKIQFSRELAPTSKGHQELYELLGISLQLPLRCWASFSWGIWKSSNLNCCHNAADKNNNVVSE